MPQVSCSILYLGTEWGGAQIAFMPPAVLGSPTAVNNGYQRQNAHTPVLPSAQTLVARGVAAKPLVLIGQVGCTADSILGLSGEDPL
jgi:hypothetical protein